ncbi:serine/threonine protein kinase [Coemansia sp. RSA 552]|nr:serine/threonine protein kinase [Coemansia sp. RSA 552]
MPGVAQVHAPSPLVSEVPKGTVSSGPSDAGGSPVTAASATPRHARHASLRIRTDSAKHDVSLPQQPKTAGVKPPPPQPQSPAPKSAGAVSGITPIVIKRNTSFSQRLHNLLHRDKPQKHSPAAPTGSGIGTPTIAYRTPTMQTQSTDASATPSASASASNSPPGGGSPHASVASMAKDSSAYHAQRGFEPVPEDKVFAVSNVSLRTVQHHGTQIRKSFDPQQRSRDSSPSTVGEPERSMRGVSIASTGDVSREASAHSVSREPSQNTLHQYQSAAEDAHGAPGGTLAAGAGVRDAAAPPPESRPEPQKAGSAALAGQTLPARPTAADIADNRERLAAGTTRDLHATPAAAEAAAVSHKKPCPVYSTHKASLNQFGRQTKVIGKGTGGTVRLLQGAELDTRPPSLRSGPPSSHPDEPAYKPREHKLFAVKEFRKRRDDETPRAYMKKVTSEFCIGSSIHQENVIETLDLIFEGDRVYEIMEYCPYDLFTFVAMGNMDLEETFCWFKQVCQGVQYLHRIGIAHRDLKLENCLLTERGVVKIIDFGCATVFKTPFQKEPSKVVGVCGSDPYIAPEVLMSRRQLPYFAQVADIWSVGIMYMCMTLLKFPWRIADTDADRNYGSYIRDWPRGREKLFAQLPKLRHDGKATIEGMVYPDTKGRSTMDQVMESQWMKEIDVCHMNHPARSHTHRMKTE